MFSHSAYSKLGGRVGINRRWAEIEGLYVESRKWGYPHRAPPDGA